MTSEINFSYNIKHIISSCEPGAARGALEAARILGIKTYGYMLSSCKTLAEGPRPDLRERYGLLESGSTTKEGRDRHNTDICDGILAFHPKWVCDYEPWLLPVLNARATIREVYQQRKPMFVIKKEDLSTESKKAEVKSNVLEWLKICKIENLQVIGPYEEKYYDKVFAFISFLFSPDSTSSSS